MVTFASGMPAYLIPIIILAVFGFIVLIVLLIKKKFKVFQSDEKPKSDKEIAAEELDRVLEVVDDEEAVSAMQAEYLENKSSKK